MRHTSHYVVCRPASMGLMLPLTDIVPPFLAAAAIAYAILAVRVARSTPHNPSNPINIFLFLMAGLVAGAAFSYGATDANLYGIGRVLSFFSAGFAAIVFFMIYREYTVGRGGVTRDEAHAWYAEFEQLSASSDYYFASGRVIFESKKPA